MVSETWKSIKEHFAERTSSPFLASYGLSWIAYNWKSILIVAYADKETATELIEQIRCVTEYPDNFLNPLYFAIAFSLFYPAISVVPFYIWEYFGVQKIKIKRRLSLERPISISESMRIKEENIKLRELLEEKTREYRERIVSLETENTKLYEVNRDLSKGIEASGNGGKTLLDPVHLKALAMHAGLPRGVGENPEIIASKMRLTLERARLVLENLENLRLIKYVRQNEAGEHVYELTESGRKYLAEHGEL